MWGKKKKTHTSFSLDSDDINVYTELYMCAILFSLFESKNQQTTHRILKSTSLIARINDVSRWQDSINFENENISVSYQNVMK